MQYKALLEKSDHCCIQFEYTIKSRNEKLPETFKHNYWKGDYRSIIQDLTSVDWKSVL